MQSHVVPQGHAHQLRIFHLRVPAAVALPEYRGPPSSGRRVLSQAKGRAVTKRLIQAIRSELQATWPVLSPSRRKRDNRRLSCTPINLAMAALDDPVAAGVAYAMHLRPGPSGSAPFLKCRSREVHTDNVHHAKDHLHADG